jgi:sugar/nucleoside kinase (ribokinase family)
MARRAIVAGHLCLDLTPQFLSDAMAGPGELVVVGPATLSTGGAVSNTGLSMLRLGVDAYLCGKVGDDFFGRSVRDILERHTAGSSRGIVVSTNDATSYTFVVSPLGKDRAFVHCPGANDTFGPEDIPQSALDRADLLHFGYPPLMRRMFGDGGRELADLLGRAKQAGLTTSLDLSYVDPTSECGKADWRAILRAALPSVDLFVPSLGELRAIWDATPGERAESAATALRRVAIRSLESGAQVVLVKAGTDGIYLRSRQAAIGGRAAPAPSLGMQAWAHRELWSPAFAPDVVATTTGAGDAAVAGFLAAFMRGDGPERALTVACAAGACCCERADGTSGVRTWDDTWARLASGWRQLPLDLAAFDWQWDSGQRLWRGPDEAFVA